VTLNKQILPRFARTPVDEITPAAVRDWHGALRGKTGERQRSAAYALLRTILYTAVDDELISVNPWQSRDRSLRRAGGMWRSRRT
jgi:hypothetical protein